jgi:hypothetical protein
MNYFQSTTYMPLEPFDFSKSQIRIGGILIKDTPSLVSVSDNVLYILILIFNIDIYIS